MESDEIHSKNDRNSDLSWCMVVLCNVHTDHLQAVVVLDWLWQSRCIHTTPRNLDSCRRSMASKCGKEVQATRWSNRNVRFIVIISCLVSVLLTLSYVMKCKCNVKYLVMQQSYNKLNQRGGAVPRWWENYGNVK